MREFIVLMIMTLIFAVGCMWFISKDSEAWSERNSEIDPLEKPVSMSSDKDNKDISSFVEELDSWGIFSDKMNYEW